MVGIRHAFLLWLGVVGTLLAGDAGAEPTPGEISLQDAHTTRWLLAEQRAATDFARASLEHEKPSKPADELLREALLSKSAQAALRRQLHLLTLAQKDRELKVADLANWMAIGKGEARMPGPRRKPPTSVRDKLSEAAEVGGLIHQATQEAARSIAEHRRLYRSIAAKSSGPSKLENALGHHPWALAVARSVRITVGKPTNPVPPAVLGIDPASRVLFEHGDIGVIRTLDPWRVLLTRWSNDNVQEGKTWELATTSLVDFNTPLGSLPDKTPIFRAKARAVVRTMWREDIQSVCHVMFRDDTVSRSLSLMAGKRQFHTERALELRGLAKTHTDNIRALTAAADHIRKTEPGEGMCKDTPLPMKVLERHGIAQGTHRAITPTRKAVQRKP